MTDKTELYKYDAAVEHMTSSERKAYLEKRLQQIVQYAYEHTPANKNRMDAAGIKPGDIRTIADLQKLPILRKDELITLHRENPPFGGLVAVPITELERIYISPGPIFDPHKVGQGPQMFAGFFGKGDVVINTWSYHLVPGGLMADLAVKNTGATVIPWGTGNTELMIQVMKELPVTGILSSATFFMTIIEKAEELGYDFKKDFKLKKAFAGGEMGGTKLRQVFREKYGVATTDVYATADTPLVAQECEKNDGMHLSMGVLTEIVNPETGQQLGANETGEIVVTAFDHIYPLIRFGTGDLSYYVDEPCLCGRTTPRLPRIMGRVGDAVRTRGMFIHPRQLDPAMAKFTEISRFQAVVTRPANRDLLTINVELKKQDVDKEKLADLVCKEVNAAVRVKVDSVEFVGSGVIPEGCKSIVDERTY